MRLHGLHENPAGNHATEMTEAGAPRGASPLVPMGECREGQPEAPEHRVFRGNIGHPPGRRQEEQNPRV